MTVKPVVQVDLTVESTSIEPEEITRRLGIEPTSSVRMGARSRPQSPPSKWHRWKLDLGSAPISSAVDEEVLAPRLGELGEQVAAALGQLRMAGAEITVGLVQHIQPQETKTHGLLLPFQIVAWLARAGANVAIDQYMLLNEDDLATEGPSAASA